MQPSVCGNEPLFRGAEVEPGEPMHHPEGSPGHSDHDHGARPDVHDLDKEKQLGVQLSHGELRYGTRGHDPAHDRGPLAALITKRRKEQTPPAPPVDPDSVEVTDVVGILALRGILKRAWEYITLMDDFKKGVEDLGLGPYLRSLTATKDYIPPDDKVIRLLQLDTPPGLKIPLGTNLRAVGWSQLAQAVGLAADEQAPCVILELLKRTNAELHEVVDHCK